MRPNVLTAFRRVNIWLNVRAFCIYFERCLEGAQTHGTHSKEHRWEDTVFIILSHHFLSCLLLLFTLHFSVPLLSFFKWFQCTKFVVSYTYAGCRLICRNASYNFTPACLVVMLTVGLLIICFWKLQFYFAVDLHYQLVGAVVVCCSKLQKCHIFVSAGQCCVSCHVKGMLGQ